MKFSIKDFFSKCDQIRSVLVDKTILLMTLSVLLLTDKTVKIFQLIFQVLFSTRRSGSLLSTNTE